MLTYRLDEGTNHYTDQRSNVLDFHPSQHLEEASGRSRQSNNYTPFQLVVE